MDLGTRLREARESKGLSLEEIQQVTKIQKRYLQAIEKGDHSTLPGTFYARAFIREYAAAVGLNPDEVMEEHKNELPASPQDSSVAYNRVQRSKEEASPANSNFSRVFPTIITIILIGVIIFAAYFFLSQLNSNSGGDSGDQGSGEDEIIIDNSVEENNSGDENSEETDDAADDNQASDDSANEEDEAAEETNEDSSEEQEELNVEVTETGSGGFPQHTVEISQVDELELTIEVRNDSYLEVMKEPNGETLIDSKIYGKDDSPITVDVSEEEQIFIKTGFVPGTTVKLNEQEIEFPVENMQQKLLIKVAE
ncbi:MULTISPECIES: helix-turn-helix domain-containing protein [Thalassobacillus]|uniref:helix-turn-helix domain-containing protein n=1 Tax=Thalassobacillus TaxID=331971 RepID=UPI0015939006|nr:helix-turn-helix transcriptional regulator [Thalassobacillus devorans]